MLAVENPLIRAPVHETTTSNNRKPSIYDKYEKTKQNVGVYKSKINDYQWRKLTEAQIPNPKKRVCSKAYFKLSEIIQTCALPEPETSFHICEAPGGFIQSTCDEFPNLKKWIGISLNDGIQFRTELLDLEKGELLKPIENGNILLECVRESFILKVDLVTGDGACMDENHDNLEEVNYNLLLAQTDIALRCLNFGGNFVCKFFEGMNTNTRVLIAILTNCFENVSIIKPNSSKCTNSERYLVCRGFETYKDVINTKWFVYAGWLDELQEVIDEYATEQIKSLDYLFKLIN